VLQNLGRKGREISFPRLDRDPAGHLASWGSHPRWLVERWIGRWGADDAAALVEADNARPELYLRPLGVSVDQARARLGEAEIASEGVDFAPDSLRVLAPASAA
jgi:16S rRNA (cytosine967-C5)-methyltransferase